MWRAPRPASLEPRVAVPFTSLVRGIITRPGPVRVEFSPVCVAVNTHDTLSEVLDIVRVTGVLFGVPAFRNIYARHVDTDTGLIVRVVRVLLRTGPPLPANVYTLNILRKIAHVMGPLCVLFYRVTSSQLITIFLTYLHIIMGRE